MTVSAPHNPDLPFQVDVATVCSALVRQVGQLASSLARLDFLFIPPDGEHRNKSVAEMLHGLDYLAKMDFEAEHLRCTSRHGGSSTCVNLGRRLSTAIAEIRPAIREGVCLSCLREGCRKQDHTAVCKKCEAERERKRMEADYPADWDKIIW